MSTNKKAATWLDLNAYAIRICLTVWGGILKRKANRVKK